MKHYNLTRGNSELNSTSGNHLCGFILDDHAKISLPVNFQQRRSDAISDRDILLSQIGLLCNARSDFNDIELYHNDELFIVNCNIKCRLVKKRSMLNTSILENSSQDKKGRKSNMKQIEISTENRQGKHLKKQERIVIETMLRNGHSNVEIASYLHRSARCIQREIKTGKVIHLQSDLSKKVVYNADRAQDIHDRNARAKGPALKLDKHPELVEFVSQQILDERRSPDVVSHLLKQVGFSVTVCTKTLYTYIDRGLIPGITNDTLWEKTFRRKHKKKAVRRHKKPHTQRTCIEKRPKAVGLREEFGHWEIDLVVGGKDKSKPVLMTLTERKTRRLIIRKLKDKTQASVLKALRAIEVKMGPGQFRSQFKSITADNGSEFLDVENMEQSAISKKMRVKMYYAHPYSSWERGTNENINKMVRRFIVKGTDIGKFTLKSIKEIEDWINHYPRKILKYKTAMECFDLEVVA